MSNTNRDDIASPGPAGPRSSASALPRSIEGLLRRAAEVAASDGTASDQFMAAAWQAYLAAHPGMREELEDKALRSELKKLRKRGLIAAA